MPLHSTTPQPYGHARLWAKVNFTGPLWDGSRCWLWTKCLVDGYAQMRWRGKRIYAHRMAYTLLKGPILPRLTLDHLCRNRACINPDHAEPVSSIENVMRGMSFAAVNARKTHCSFGHSLSGANLYSTPRGSRECRTCRQHRRDANERTRT